MDKNKLLLEDVPEQLDNNDINRPKWSGYFKVVQPLTQTQLQTDSQSIDGSSLYSNSSWYQFVTYGSAARLNRYKEYDLMDSDCDITRSLDIIAEEMCGNIGKNDLPFVLDMANDSQMPKNSHYVVALTAALKRWCEIQSFSTRVFPTNRKTIKYGDTFYLKKNNLEKWIPLSPKQIIGAVVNKDDVTEILGWQIHKNLLQAHGSETIGNYQIVGSEQNDADYELVNTDEIVRFSINTELADTAPFGESVLQSVYRTFRQKQLLEDAILIYRLARAPERMLFKIDTRGIQPHNVHRFLDKVKNDMNQKMIPSPNASGGIESTYNPSSMMENFYFPVGEDGKGSSVEILQGGMNLGELQDLEYFEDKVFRGMRIPLSYIKTKADNPAVFNDGKIGLAYIEETRFSQYIERLQADQDKVYDTEFKKFVAEIGLNIDPSYFSIKLPSPTNFSTYRELELNVELLNALSSADSIRSISKRYAMKKYLNWNEAEIAINEQWKRQELGLKSNDPTAFRKIYDDTAQDDGDIGGGSFRDLDSSFGGNELDLGDTDEQDNVLNSNDKGNLNAGSGDQLGSSGAET